MLIVKKAFIFKLCILIYLFSLIRSYKPLDEREKSCSIQNCASCYPHNWCDYCIYGFLLENNKCSKITCTVANCQSCSASNVCQQCKSGFYLDTNSNPRVCRVTCTVGNCQSCSAPNVCQQCQSGFYLDTNSNPRVCRVNCCVPNCQYCNNPNVCAQCNSGYTIDTSSGTPYCKVTGIVGYCQSCSAANVCQQCQSGFFLDTNSNPQICRAKSKNDCGNPAITPIASNLRIVGGVPAKPHSWPWQISLRKKYNGNKNYHNCGGSILNATIIISAAHCFGSNSAFASDYFIVAGDFDQTTDSDGITQMREIAWYRIHESYDSSKGPAPNDIAIIVLKTPLQFNDNVSPICLPSTSIVSGENCYSTGWGDTEGTAVKTTLNQARLPIINLSTCKALSGYSLVLDSMICAGYLQGGVDTCQGDSGGPFVCKNSDGKWYLDGIVVWGIGCADANKPGIYTRTFSFLNWIKQTSGFN